MALVKTFDKYELQEAFRRMDRDYFSLEGYDEILRLFEETDCGTNTELDVIGICCDFTEDDPQTVQDDYDNIEEIADTQDEDGNIDEDALLDALNYYTWAVQLSNGNILYQRF